MTTEALRAVGDLGPLVRFRFAGMRSRGQRTARIALAVFVGLTVAAVVVPAYWTGAGDPTNDHFFNLVLLLPTAYIAFLLTTTLAVIAGGGGRELLPRDQAVAFPISPVTDHFGALLLAPLNIAWIIQSWCLLGITAFVAGPQRLALVAATVLLWIALCTAIGQCLAWLIELIRRGPHGIGIVRTLWTAVGLAALALVATGNLGAFLDRLPSTSIVTVVLAPTDGSWGRWVIGLVVFTVAFLAVAALGGVLATFVSRRLPREEARAEGQTFAARPMPESDLGALTRTDRASVLRSVPLRRGFFVLALLPGLVAAGGRLSWDMMPVLPGLVASGGALLFGINAWCLDGVGALWRDSLPVDPQVVLVARMRVLFEILLGATVLTVLVATVRAAGAPTACEVAALAATCVVVSLQVVARSMHWSVRRPFAMDLRSARGTPAPPFAMLAYSSWLAFSSTMTGMLFTLTTRTGDPRWPVVLALPFVLAACRRLVITAREWSVPEIRARVIATVSAR